MRGTSRSVAAVVIVAALAATITGCSKASTPTIYSHSEAVSADDEMFTVLNDTIDATGGLQAWKAWSSNKPLDKPVGTGDHSNGGGECLPTNGMGMAGDPLGDYDGASLNSTDFVDADATLVAVKKVWTAAGYTNITTDVSTDVSTDAGADDGIVVRAAHEAPSPTLTFTYRDTKEKQKVLLEGDSICQSYDYLNDDEPDRYDDPTDAPS